MDRLTKAINEAKLSVIIHHYFPESGIGSYGHSSFKAVWRGDSNPSASLFKSKDGCWLLKDHGNDKTYNAYQFLTEIVGLNHESASKELGVREESKPKPSPHMKHIPGPPPESYTRATMEFPIALANRGFTDEDMVTYGIRSDHGDAIIPVPNAINPLNFKRRKAAQDAKPKYVYEISDVGAPAWHYPGANNNMLLIVEGELNAMIAHSALGQSIEVIGVPGASHVFDVGIVDDKHVYIYADNDKAGATAKAKWLESIRKRPFESVTVLPSNSKDFCDIAGQDGKAALLKFLEDAIADTLSTYTIQDRLVTDQHTVKNLQDNAQQFITGQIVNPTGYYTLDNITFGLPPSGISLIAALPSSGKSIMLRDILMHNAIRGKKVMLFSPDQSADSIYILLASVRAGIPAWRVQRKIFSYEMLEKYGKPEEIIKKWKEVFDDTILNFSKRFRISGESEVKEIKRLTEEALDQGFSMFGGDYIQIFEPEDSNGKELDGKAIKDIKKQVHKWGVPFILAAQLAKYKFGRNIKRDGIPYASDIEGSGKYYQASEQVYMIFNGEIYWKEYVDQNDPPPQPSGFYNDTGKVRIYVRKNKLGEVGGWVYLNWNKELLTFENF